LAGRWTRLDLRRCFRATPGRRGQPHFQSVDAAGSWLPRPKSQAEMPRWIALLAPGDCSPRRRCSAGPASQDAVEPLGVVRGQAGPADRGQDPIWQQRGAAQRVGDAGHVGGRRRHVPAWVGRGSAVAGPVVRHQRMPRSAAAGSRGSGGAPRFGVPWCQNTARRPSAPSAKASYACSVRPSRSNRSVCFTTHRAYLGLERGSNPRRRPQRAETAPLAG
jgi:hypothetical protein